MLYIRLLCANKSFLLTYIITNVCDRHGYSVSATHQLMSFNGHKKSCRRVRFSADGSQLVTASKDKSVQVIDMSAGSVTAKLKDAHEYVFFPLNSQY